MKIKRFKAQNFRNIEECDITFSEGVNLFYGDNAQGKTNVVEGIYFFSRGKSFRLSEEKELTRFNEEGFRLFIEYEDKDGEHTLEYASFGREKRRIKDGYRVSKMGELVGNFRSVLFFPDNVELVKGGPEERRAFLNVAIAQIFGTYIDNYSKYKQILENRNALLKKASKGQYFDEGELISWSEMLAEYAAYIVRDRVKYTEMLRPHITRIASELSGGKELVTAEYKCDAENQNDDTEGLKAQYRLIFTENLDKERIVGTSLYGPHRDDLLIDINGVSARSFASQGQQRSIVLAIKLGEGAVIKEMYGEEPVFLFDDVLSELDEQRRKYVICGMKDKQIIITSCEGEDFSFADQVMLVKEGKYVFAHR